MVEQLGDDFLVRGRERGLAAVAVLQAEEVVAVGLIAAFGAGEGAGRVRVRA